MSSKQEIEFIVPTPEQNYKNLMEIASGIKSVKVSQFHKDENLPLESNADVESYEHKTEITPEQQIKIESPELIQKQADVESEQNDQEVKSIEKSPKTQFVEKTKEEKIPEKSKEEKTPEKPKEEKTPEKSKEEKTPEKTKIETPERKELSCDIQEKMGRFPFKPFAETARAVGIPAYSSYKGISDLYNSFNGVLDSTTLLELYYFDYDNLAISRPIFDGKEDAWISKSLLSLIYKSEREDPLSFLMLGYGITSTHWESFITKEDIEATEINVEDSIQEHDLSHGDVILRK